MPIMKLLLTLFISILLIGCTNNKGDIKIVASEKSLPFNFNEIAVERKEVPHFQYLVDKVDNQTLYEEKWKAFNLTGQIPRVDFAENEIFFIGIYESGSCPYKLEELKITIDLQVLYVHLVGPDGACTSDGTPRTFVIEVNKDSIKNVKNIAIVEMGVETIIPI